VATRLPAGLRRRGGWSGTVLPLPAALPSALPPALPPAGPAPGWIDVLTGRVFGATREVPLADLTWRLPVALLIPEDS
jgi:(1->4)-alpha-D-glucan 1-alpha-D-glucosylmutase